MLSHTLHIQISSTFTLRPLRIHFWTEGRGWGLGVKEGGCGDEHWVLCVTSESLNTPSETSDVLYAGSLDTAKN